MSDGNESYIEHLQKCYNQLRRSRLVKQAPVVNDDSLQHFARILNSALPQKGIVEQEVIDRCIKTQYFWNQRGFIRSLHPTRSSKNMRKDARCFVLLTIGLEIVREFELEKVIHLTWNKTTQQYELESIIDPQNPPDPETFRAQRLEERNERMKGGRRHQTPTETSETPTETSETHTETPATPTQTPTETTTVSKSTAWGDSSAPQ